MKKVIAWAAVIGIPSALELAFGINETGGRIALVLLCWSVFAIPLVFLGKKILEAVEKELMHY